MKRFYLLTALFALTAAGCVKVDLVDVSTPPLPENLTVEQTDYTLGAFEKRTATAAFSEKGDWTLSIVYDDADADAAWLTADAAGGAAGEQSLGMSAARNFQAAPRTAYVDLVCGEQTVRLTVTQTGLSDDMDFSALFDVTFAQKLQERDIVADAEKITMQEMQSMAIMTELDISGTYDNPGSLTSLRGIEYFEALTKLNCNRNSLPTLDISQNTELTELRCEYNSLTELDISQNMKLTYLNCNNNSLTELDVSQNTELTELRCDFNSLTELGLNTELTVLHCQSNSLPKLYVSQNTKLTELWCGNNQLTELDVSKNTELTDLPCYYNQLTELDVSKNTKLTQLTCGTNQLKELDVSKKTKLTQLRCEYNQLKELDVSLITELTDLSCENNPGDGNSVFPLTVWGDQAEKPGSLNVLQPSWRYNDKYITIQYQTAPGE